MKRNQGLLIVLLLLLSQFALSQKLDSLKRTRYFSGVISVTNNGISIIPSFSLGKPAAIFIFSMAKRKFSFEPDIRFSLKGKPWSFVFWSRYLLVSREKFKMNAGANLGINFKTAVLPINGDSTEINVARRYLAGELFPRFLLSKNISVGIYYLFSHGLDPGSIRNISQQINLFETIEWA